MLQLLPDRAAVESGGLSLGGVRASAAEEYGTPLLVYCEQTLHARAQAYRRAVPDALLAYGVKGSPSVALLQLSSPRAPASTSPPLGELGFAIRAGIPGDLIVVHGNEKSDEERRAAAEAGAPRRHL